MAIIIIIALFSYQISEYVSAPDPYVEKVISTSPLPSAEIRSSDN